jgi:hypothetical protein
MPAYSSIYGENSHLSCNFQTKCVCGEEDSSVSRERVKAEQNSHLTEIRIKIYKYHQNTTDLLYSTTFGLHVSTP